MLRNGKARKAWRGHDPVTTRQSRPLTYKSAGVDIDAGAALVDRIRPLAAATARPGSVGQLGGFGGLFDLEAAGYRDPLLVAATDGVGTKLEIAITTGKHDTVGIDLVAMCVNDLVVQGAEPLFFLDYLATGRLDLKVAEAVIAGIANGCRIAGCALIGGETAEHPGSQAGGSYDLAGFAVGAVARDNTLPRSDIGPGDVVLGLASSGLHSNGFSLVRKLVGTRGLDYAAPVPFDDGATLGEALLEPTRIYVAACLAAHGTGLVKGLAHITGGGLIENIPRLLPARAAAVIDAGAWPLPEVFEWLASANAIEPAEMARTFNCGIGMIVVISPGDEKTVTAVLAGHGEVVHKIGSITEREDGAAAVVVSGPKARWGASEPWRAQGGDPASRP